MGIFQILLTTGSKEISRLFEKRILYDFLGTGRTQAVWKVTFVVENFSQFVWIEASLQF